MAPNTFTVLIADPHPVVRAGIKAALARERCQILEAQNGRDAARLALARRPHLAVLEAHLPRMNGFCVAHQIIADARGTRVLLFALADDDLIERAMSIGVHGYLCKESPIERLPEAVRALRKGLTWFDEPVREHQAMHALMPGYPRKLNITHREQQILQLIAELQRNKDIAGELNLSEKTVDRHKQNLMKKLREHDAQGLTRYAVRQKIIPA